MVDPDATTPNTPTVADVMTLGAIGLPPDASATEAAQQMRDQDVGDVLVIDGEQLVGVVTDRDLVVRVLAEGADSGTRRIGDVCSSDPVVVRPEQLASEAVELMRQAAVRRLPVVDSTQRPIGMVTLGDLAAERQPDSALGQISTQPPND